MRRVQKILATASAKADPTKRALPHGATVIVSLVVLFAWLPSLHADPLDPRELPAGTTWFVHLDVDALRKTTIGVPIEDRFISREDIEKAIEKFGIDPTRDIHSITVYGSTYAPDAGVLILRGRIDRSRLDALLKTLPDYHNETLAGYVLYFWNETAPNRRHVGSFVRNVAIVIAPESQTVVTALQVLDGKSPTLANDSPLTAQAPAGTILQAAATGLAQAKGLSIQSPVIRQCESGSLAVGERDGQVFVSGRVITESADTAAKVRSLIEGAKALGQLQAADNADWVKLLDGLRVTTSSASVEIQWECSAIELVRMVQNHQAHKAASTQPGNEQ